MKRLYLLLAALLTAALLCACGSSAPAPAPDPQPEEPAEQPAGESAVTALICSDGDRLLRFHRDDDGSWLWTDDVSFPLDGRYVDTLLAMTRELDTLQSIPSPQGPENYDLYNVRRYVTVRRDDGTSVTYRVGKQAESGEYYVNTTADPDRICLAPERMLSAMGRSIYDMALLPRLPALTTQSLRSVTVTRGDEETRITVKRGRWLLDDRDVTDETQMLQLAELLAAPAVSRCLDYAPSDGAAALCGLDPPAAMLEAEYTDAGERASFVLSVGSLTADGSSCCVTVGDDGTIYLMDAGPLAVLRNWNE